MIFSDIRDYLQQHEYATLSDMACHFGTQAEVLNPMLDLWQRKGKVNKLSPSTCSRACKRCTISQEDIYQWIGN